MQQQQPTQSNGPITRAEFEARHAALSAQVSQNEARVFAEQAAMKADLERKFDKLLDALERNRQNYLTQASLDQQLVSLKDDINELKQEQLSRTERFWMRFGPLVALAVGLIALIEFVSRVHLLP